jgi:hypothetical protein
MIWDEKGYWDEVQRAFIKQYREWAKEQSHAPKDAAYSEPIDNRQVK